MGIFNTPRIVVETRVRSRAMYLQMLIKVGFISVIMLQVLLTLWSTKTARSWKQDHKLEKLGIHVHRSAQTPLS